MKRPQIQVIHRMKVAPRLGCIFFRSANGNEPVREWLRSLDDDVCDKIGGDIKDVQYRWPVGPPLVKSLQGGLHYVCSSFRGNAYRVFFVLTTDDRMKLLHGFQKTTQKMPKRHIEIARERMR